MFKWFKDVEQTEIGGRTMDIDNAEEAVNNLKARDIDPEDNRWREEFIKEIDAIELEEQRLVAKGMEITAKFAWFAIGIGIGYAIFA